MSGQSLVMFFSVIAIAFAANRADDSSGWLEQKNRERNPGVTARGPASVSGKKETALVQKDLMKHTHKARGPLAAMVELVGPAPEKPGDVFVLKGILASESSLEGVEFSWGLPAGVVVVNGVESSVVAYLSEGKPFETIVTLRQVSPVDERVTLRVRGREDEMRFGDTAVYHTFDQEKVMSARLNLKASTEAYLKENSTSVKQLELLESPSASSGKLKIHH